MPHLLAMVLVLSPYFWGAGSIADVSAFEKRAEGRPISIEADENPYGTDVVVKWNGEVPQFVTKTIDSPPRIVIDFLRAVDAFGTMKLTTKIPKLKQVRAGHHSEKMSLVLEFQEPPVPIYSVTSADNIFTVTFPPSHQGKHEEEVMEAAPGDRDRKKTGPYRKEGNRVVPPEQGGKGRIGAGEGQGDPRITAGGNRSEERPKETVDKYCGQEGRDDAEGISAQEMLTRVENDDGREDRSLFMKGVKAYRARDWPRAIENLSPFTQDTTTGGDGEKAHFLLAKSYEQRYSESISDHLNDVIQRYEDAVNRFPTSPYRQDALLAIGNLYFANGNHIEALGYYNLVLKKGPETFEAPKAMLQKARILGLRKKGIEALSALEKLVERYPCSQEKTEAKIEMAKILHEMNSFRRSLDILSRLEMQNPENVNLYPEISQYLGYNYYQMGDDARASEYLFRFYNSRPDNEESPLILAKIADAYRNQTKTRDATSVYQLVLDRYPDSEGALISLIRLAELQEEGKLKTRNEILQPIGASARIVGEGVGLPGEIYEDILKSFLNKDDNNPLTALAQLKLAILHQKQGNYGKSLDVIKDLLAKHPNEKLREQIKVVASGTLHGILSKAVKSKLYINVINTYHREKELFLMVHSPHLYLAIGRASAKMNFQDIAAEMFIRSEPLLSDEEKPSDLLLFTSKDSLEKGEYKSALARLDLLIDKHPPEKDLSEAFRLKGKTLCGLGRYGEAAEMFSSGLKFCTRPSERAGGLIEKANALVKADRKEEALATLREAGAIKTKHFSKDLLIHEEMGDLYLQLGDPKAALGAFTQVLEKEKGPENQIALRLKIAECYKHLGKKSDWQAVYNQIASLKDSFWSNLAKEKKEEMNFHREMSTTKQQ